MNPNNDDNHSAGTLNNDYQRLSWKHEGKITFDKDLLQEMEFLFLGDFLATLDEMQEMITS